MFGGVNPAQMKGMMKKMGISQTEIPVNRVIFEMQEKNLIIEDPQVIKIMMQGQESYQVVGEAQEQETERFSEEDTLLVAKQTGKTQEEAKTALEGSEGDIAEAIMQLKK